MNLKNYRASTMAEALALVKRDLGANAVILHTRSYKQGGLFGVGAKQVIEITAADGREVSRPRAAVKSKPAVSRPAANRLPDHRPAIKPAAPVAANPPLAGDLIRRTYAAAQAQLNQSSPPAAAPPSRRERSRPAPVSPLPTAALAASCATQPAEQPAALAPEAEELAQEMQFVRQMMGRVMRQQSKRNAKGQLPTALFDQYLNLLKQEVAEELANEIVTQVRTRLSADEIEDSVKVRDAVRAEVAKYIPIDTAAHKLEPTPDGRPRVIALVGPTGVGKTTTIAKLAATFKLKYHKRVGLITIDTYRIAAVEQLRTYANIIKVPLQVVTTPGEMTAAIGRCAGCDVVLIDTAGRSQRDDPKLDQLADFMRAAKPHETHLVLSSTASQSVLLETIRKFSRLRADRMIFTKLDEAVNFGVLLNVARQVKKQLSFVTTGQEVPHQIEPGRSQRLAALVMGDGGP